ncbi:MAG: hypothetical protein ACOY3I_00615 [Verrucomicrobiota bacterium]
MKIINTRGDKGSEDENKKKTPLPVRVAKHASKEVVRRVDGTAKKATDMSVLLESGVVVAIPKQVFRGRVAFQFGRRKNKLLLVCAWCGKNMGEVDSQIEGVSHGMCRECFDRVILSEFPPETH